MLLHRFYIPSQTVFLYRVLQEINKAPPIPARPSKGDWEAR